MLYAPPFPLHRGVPGLWDTAHYYNYAVTPLFSYALLNEDSKEIPLRLTDSSWRPDRWRRRFSSPGGGIASSEEAFVLPFDVAFCSVTIRNTSAKRRTLRFVGWTAREHRPDQTEWLSESATHKDHAVWSHHLRPSQRSELKVGCAFGCSGPGVRVSGRLSEGTSPLPAWTHTPFTEQVRQGPLPVGFASGGVTPEGVMWIALERAVQIPAHGKAVVHLGLSMAPSWARLTTLLPKKRVASTWISDRIFTAWAPPSFTS